MLFCNILIYMYLIRIFKKINIVLAALENMNEEHEMLLYINFLLLYIIQLPWWENRDTSEKSSKFFEECMLVWA